MSLMLSIWKVLCVCRWCVIERLLKYMMSVYVMLVCGFVRILVLVWIL